MDASQQRLEICKSLGLASLAQVHELITSAAKKGAFTLQQRGLTAKKLEQLGYTEAGLKKLGYKSQALEKLGFASPPPPAPAQPNIPNIPSIPSVPFRSAGPENTTSPEAVRQLLAAGKRAVELRSHGVGIQLLRRIGLSATDLRDLGYALEELVHGYSAAELSRAQFHIRELRRFFDGHELRRAGCSAMDMRLAGYSARELLNFGYNENHVRTAGFSSNELAREGLTRTTHLP